MLAGFFQGIVHDRALMREAQVNLARRWFAGYRLGEALPHHGRARAVRRSRANVSIQAYLTAAVMNLKTRVSALTAFFWPIYAALKRPWKPLRTPQRLYGVPALLAAYKNRCATPNLKQKRRRVLQRLHSPRLSLLK